MKQHHNWDYPSLRKHMNNTYKKNSNDKFSTEALTQKQSNRKKLQKYATISMYLISFPFNWWVFLIHKKLSWRRLIVLRSSIDHAILNFGNIENSLIYGLVYRVNVWLMHSTTDILSLQKLVLVYGAFCSLSSHLDIPEHVLMTVP